MKVPENLIEKRWLLLSFLLFLVFLQGCKFGCMIHSHAVWIESPLENETISGEVEIVAGYTYTWGCIIGECPSPETYGTYTLKWHNLDTNEWGVIATAVPITQSSRWDTTQVPNGRYDIWIYTYNYDAECNPWTLWDMSNHRAVTVSNGCVITVTLDPDEVRPTGSGTPNMTLVIVAVTDAEDNPVPGVNIILEAEAIQYSGGHQHNSDRPAGRFDRDEGITDANGEFRSRYTASAFGGEEVIIGRSQECPNEEGRATLTVRMPGLRALGSGTGYILTGSTPAHPDNHYGTSTTNNALEIVAREYAFLYSGSQLRYNDMSLMYGGLFDIGPPYGSLWHTPQREHRAGRNVDVGIVSIGRQNMLRRIIQRQRGSIYEEGDHWHLTF
ncbi:MAG: hypothetical protein AB1797_10095 [bacterium]